MRSNFRVRRYLMTTALTSVATPMLLASLLSTAMAQDSMSNSSRQIPLEYIYSGADTATDKIGRLGIWVGLNRAKPQRFLFDTGSDQFNAAIGPDAKVKETDPSAKPKIYLYGDSSFGYSVKEVEIDTLSYYKKGEEGPVLVENGGFKAGRIVDDLFTADSPYLNGLTPGDLSLHPVCVDSFDDAYCHAVGEVGDDKIFKEFFANERDRHLYEAGLPFEEKNTFAGTFGTGNWLRTENIQSSALPGLTESGYIIAANGTYAEGTNGATPGCSPCVIVDLNPALRAQFTSIMDWKAKDGDGYVDNFPGAGGNASSQYEGAYTINFWGNGPDNSGDQTQQELTRNSPVMLDTGYGDHGSISLGKDKFAELLDKGAIELLSKSDPDEPDQYEMSLTLSAPGGEQVLLEHVAVTQFTEADKQPADAVQLSVGLDFFLSQSVMYDFNNKATAYTRYFVSADNFTTAQGNAHLGRVTPAMGAREMRDKLDANGKPVQENGKPAQEEWGMLGVAGVVSGSGSLTLDPRTDVRLTNINTYTGATNISENARLTLAGLGSIERSAKVVVDGDLDILKHGNGDANWGISDLWNDVRIRSLAGAKTGAVLIGDRTLILTNANDTFAGSISDLDEHGIHKDGSLIVAGGVQTLSGENIFTGMTTVGKGAALLLADTGALASPVSVSGLFANDGKVAGATAVEDGGIAAGTGHYNSLTIGKGGKVTPGSLLDPGAESSMLTVDGDFVQQAGSVYLTSLGADGNADSIAVKGKAIIDGGTSVELVRENAGGLSIGTQYEILTADGGVQGAYGALTGDLYTDSPFVDFALDHQSNAIYLDVARNALAFADVGNTFNQKSTAAAVESIGSGDPLYDSIVFASEAGSRAAFDQLSGEIHASLGGALIEDSHFVRDAATDRIRAAFEGVGASSVPVSAYGPDGLEAVSAASDGAAFWGRGFGAWGHINGDGNASRLDRSTGGFLAGVDTPVADTWRIGLIAGYSHSSFDADERLSSSSSSNFHLGAYGGSQWGNLGFRSGLAYSWHRVDTRRNVLFSGFADSLTSDYDAGTFQAFGEFGYRIDAGPTSIEPYANLAYVHLKADGFNEKGGVAALSGASQSRDVTFSTLGLRGAADIQLGSISAVARGGIGWRHTFGAVTPLTTMAFSTGVTFDATGTPIARDTALIEAGIDMNLTEHAVLGITYQGQAASNAQEHGFNAKLNVRF
jgi:subtilase-type serine protease